MTQQTAVQKKEDAVMVIKPFGTDTTVKLSIKIVKELIAGRTARGQTCSDRDALRFMMLCQAKALNPYEQDAFLIGYDGKDGPVFTQITAHQAFMKRAECSKEYDGMESGVIVQNPETGEVTEREGDFILPEERKNLVGGWARVHKKEQKIPTYRRLSLHVFDTGQSRWAKDPAGMIVKCAEADALRSAFPTKLGGLYSGEELSKAINVDATVMPEIDTSRLVTGPDGQPTGDVKPAGEAKQEPAPAAASGPPAEKPAANKSAKKELEMLCEREKVAFTDFQKWAMDTNNVRGADAMAGFMDVPEADAKRLLRSPGGMLAQIRDLMEASVPS